jgi:hypothetical protein
MPHDTFAALQEFRLASGKTSRYYALAELEAASLGKISRLPEPWISAPANQVYQACRPIRRRLPAAPCARL